MGAALTVAFGAGAAGLFAAGVFADEPATAVGLEFVESLGLPVAAEAESVDELAAAFDGSIPFEV